MMNGRHFLYMTLTFLAFLLTGCHDEDFMGDGPRTGGIAFSVSTMEMKATAQGGTTTRASQSLNGHAVYVGKVSASDINMHRTRSLAAATRGEMVTDDNFYDSFHVVGYSYASDDDAKPKKFIDDDVKKDYNWTATELWPDAGSYDHAQFYALTPYNKQVSDLKLQADGSMPSFTYTVPTDITKQSDLLAATQTVGANRAEGSTVDMKFYHLLTAVDVVLGQMPSGVTVKSVSIGGVADKGTFANSAWTPSTTSTGSFSATGLSVDAASNKNVSLLSGKGTYMMIIPQTVPDGAKLSVNVDVAEGSKTSNYTLSTSIAGDKWQMGHTYTYTISTSAVGKGYVLTVSPENSELGGTGGTTTVQMLSYSYYKGGDESNRNSVDIYAEFQEWDDKASKWEQQWSKKPPSWLKCDKFVESNGYQVFTSKQGDSKNTVDVKFTVSTPTAVTGKHSSNINASVLPSDYSSNKECWWDLSQNARMAPSGTDWDRENNTANCYIVSHPGRYIFPLVYGNALKNHDDNTAAYSGDIVDYTGNKITSPRTLEGQVEKTAILWKDPSDKDWIRSSGDNGLTPSSTKKRACFEIVPNSGVSGGNAVIAAYDANGTIVWSWHIWLLDTKDLFGQNTMQDITVTNSAGSQITLMPVNLGWTPSNDTYKYYPRHRVRVRLTQATDGDPANNLSYQGGQTAMFTIDQHAQYDEASTQGYCPYYQWGRKDPLLDATKDETDINKSWNFMVYSLKNPSHFFTNWTNNIFTSWNNATEPNYSKTIYDPCPVGYHVPRSFAFTGFTADGNESSDTNPANIWSSDSHGVAFYSDRQTDGKGATIYFPVIDWLDNTETSQRGSIYWTSLLNSTTDENGNKLNLPTFMFIGSTVYPQYKANGFYAGYVRPERE